MSEDKKDKDSSQDKIKALKAELEELKAQEEIKKLNSEIDSIKKNSPTEEKEKVENFIPSKEEKVVVQTFSNSGEIKKKGYIGKIISILYVLFYNFIVQIVMAVAIYQGSAASLISQFWILMAIVCTGTSFVSMLLTSILQNNNKWRTFILLSLTAFWSVLLIKLLQYPQSFTLTK